MPTALYSTWVEPDTYLTLDDLLLRPPLPAVVATLIVLGVVHLGRALARRVRRADVRALDVAAGFVLVTALIGAAVHGFALAGMLSLPLLRGVGIALSVGGALAARRAWQQRGHAARSAWNAAVRLPVWQRVVVVACGLTTLGLWAGALGPVTDIDSVNYHVGVPLEWIRHGGAVARPDWFHARLVGLGEMITLLGLAMGTDGLAALFQFGGLIVAIVAVWGISRSSLDRVLASVLVLACPALVPLVYSQKFQLLPAASTTLALVLIVRRFDRLDERTALLAAGCIAFAMACKYSFLLTGGLVLGLMLLSAIRSGNAVKCGLMAAAWIGVLLLPIFARNLTFYGDPLSPLLERWKADADPAVVAFGWYVRNFAGSHTIERLSRLPWDITVTRSPGNITTVLGIGALALLFANPRDRLVRLVAVCTVAAAVLVAGLGQLSARFFVEPYLWGVAAAAMSAWSRPKLLYVGAVGLQLLVVLTLAIYGSAKLVPAVWSAHARDQYMRIATSDYAATRWMDATLGRDDVVVTDVRAGALIPRRFLSSEAAYFRSFSPAVTAEERARLLTEATLEHQVDVIVHVVPVEQSHLAPLEPLFGEPLGPPASFLSTGRNPWRRGPWVELQATAVRRDR